MTKMNRRQMLRGAGAMTFIGGAGLLQTFGASPAFAADTTGYKALVCVFLKGGMDNFDTILPKDEASWNMLRDVRGDFLNTYPGGIDASTRARDRILRLAANNEASFGGRQFGLPEELSPLGTLFSDGDLAVVGNVGPLIEPTTRTTIENNTARVPKRLFSHNDQQSTWMALETEGARLGWGGRFADAAIRSSATQNPSFSAIATGGNDNFLSGELTRQYTVSSGGPRDIRLLRQRGLLGNDSGGDQAREALERFYAGEGFDDSNLYTRDVIESGARAIDLNRLFSEAYENALPITTAFPDSGLGGQLRTVAETINIRQALNMSRQVFFVSTGGYDTHSGQAAQLARLHTDLAGSLSAFASALKEIGVFDQVTTFTASDFGRTLVINGDGSDHGWGGHHFVMGGAVNGRNIYGDVPLYEPEGEGFTRNRGRAIPDVSVDQYAATLGKWFGLDPSELGDVLPNLANFDAQDLGFMG